MTVSFPFLLGASHAAAPPQAARPRIHGRAAG